MYIVKLFTNYMCISIECILMGYVLIEKISLFSQNYLLSATYINNESTVIIIQNKLYIYTKKKWRAYYIFYCK